CGVGTALLRGKRQAGECQGEARKKKKAGLHAQMGDFIETASQRQVIVFRFEGCKSIKICAMGVVSRMRSHSERDLVIRSGPPEKTRGRPCAIALRSFSCEPAGS